MKFLAPLVFCIAFTTNSLGIDQIPETIDTRILPTPSPHWLWVDDVVFNYMGDGRASLIDGDTGAYLGMLSTGVGFMTLGLPSDQSEIYSVETYYTRGLRGDRTDVVTIYDVAELKPVGEIEVPPKRHMSLPTLTNFVLTDDNRFLLIYNFTPAQSVSVVDVKARKFLGEIETTGCAQIYVTGKRTFQMLCQDGSTMRITLDDNGGAKNKAFSEPFFNPAKDPIHDDGARLGDSWYFISYTGDVYQLDGSSGKPTFPESWSLLNVEDRAASWLPGGGQFLAIHEPTKRLFVAMHQGGDFSHKDPGTEIWIYDLVTHQRLQRITANNVVTSVAVTRDDKPLMFTAFLGSTDIEIYDATSGEHLRTVGHMGAGPSALQVP